LKYCTNCGSKLLNAQIFCGKCGISLNESTNSYEENQGSKKGELEKTDSSKDTINWISCVISGIGLVFTFIGVVVGIFPLILGTLIHFGFIFMILAVLLSTLIIVLQGSIVVMIFLNITNKGHTMQIQSMRKTAISISGLSLFFLLLTGLLFYTLVSAPLFGQLLLISPFITFVAGLIFKEYDENPIIEKNYSAPELEENILQILAGKRGKFVSPIELRRKVKFGGTLEEFKSILQRLREENKIKFDRDDYPYYNVKLC